MKKVLPALLLAMFLTGAMQEARACSCIYLSDYFCPSVNEMNQIVLGKVLNKYDAGPNQAPLMDIEVIEWLKTEDPSPDTISILGQDGLNCNESLFHFQPGDVVILGLYDYISGWHPPGISLYTIYDLSGCGRFFLFYAQGNVVGPIRPGVFSESLTDFKDDLEECILLTKTEDVLNKDYAIDLYPNPAGSQLSLETGNALGTPDRVVFLNALGQVIPVNRIQPAENSLLVADVTSLSPGIYFVVLDFGNSRRVKKWIKA